MKAGNKNTRKRMNGKRRKRNLELKISNLHMGTSREEYRSIKSDKWILEMLKFQ